MLALTPKHASGSLRPWAASPYISVRPEGAYHQWR